MSKSDAIHDIETPLHEAKGAAAAIYSMSFSETLDEQTRAALYFLGTRLVGDLRAIEGAFEAALAQRRAEASPKT